MVIHGNGFKPCTMCGMCCPMIDTYPPDEKRYVWLVAIRCNCGHRKWAAGKTEKRAVEIAAARWNRQWWKLIRYWWEDKRGDAYAELS